MTGARRFAVTSALAAVVGLCVTVWGATRASTPVSPTTPPRAGTTTVAASPARPQALPVRLTIPAISVDAPVRPVGLTTSGALGVPGDLSSTAWYDLGALPGQPGDAIIQGHLDGAAGIGVFWRLHALQPGDSVNVTLADGRRLVFSVERLAYYPYDAHPAALFSTDGPAELSLVTCAGRWDQGRGTYLERLVVTAAGPRPAG